MKRSCESFYKFKDDEFDVEDQVPSVAYEEIYCFQIGKVRRLLVKERVVSGFKDDNKVVQLEV